MPVTLASIIFFVDPVYSTLVNTQLSLAVLLVLFVNTAILPLGFLLFLKKRGLVSSLNVPDKQERYIPFLVSIVLYGSTIYFFRTPFLPSVLESMLLAILTGLLIAGGINLLWKISLHLMGIGGLIGGMLALFLECEYFLPGFFSFLLLLAGVIGSARLRLKIHSGSQLVAGFFLGGILSFVFIHFKLVLNF